MGRKRHVHRSVDGRFAWREGGREGGREGKKCVKLVKRRELTYPNINTSLPPSLPPSLLT